MSRHTSESLFSTSKTSGANGSGARASTLREVSAEQREQMIAEAAYYLAKRRHFQGGDPLQDWREAQAEIDTRFRLRDNGQD